ncbi:MAG: HAD family hydrolase [Treponema sp.]|jgi:Cof subfamily protein (haloacid dehalogenase superfamily)|nr:HAD family hydrolase [Treponema sp.]
MENKIKMIITDLDKSLLTNDRQITEYTKSVFQECIEKGILVVFATARPLRTTKPYFESIKPNAVICHCGAAVYINDKQVFQSGIEHRVAKDIVNKIIEDYPNANLAIETNDEIYSNFDLTKYYPHIIYKNMDLKKLPQVNFEKILVFLAFLESFENAEDIKKYLPDDLYLVTSDGLLGMIMNKNATKWNGIKKLLDYYEIKKENVAAFGDDFSDLEMITNCGIGVAMENGISEVKNAANYICGKNEEDGIAKWIKANVLG